MLNFAYQEHRSSYYYDSRNLDLQFSKISANQSADVCVIGCRLFRGFLLALELAEKGKKVIVLEGARVGLVHLGVRGASN